MGARLRKSCGPPTRRADDTERGNGSMTGKRDGRGDGKSIRGPVVVIRGGAEAKLTETKERMATKVRQ